MFAERRQNTSVYYFLLEISEVKKAELVKKIEELGGVFIDSQVNLYLKTFNCMF